MDFTAASRTSRVNIINESQQQFLQLQPQHVIEIQQQELEPNTQHPAFSILQPGEEENTFEIVYSGDIPQQSNNSTGIEYADTKNIELVYNAFPDGDQTSGEDIRMLGKDFQLVSDPNQIQADVGGFELMKDHETVEKTTVDDAIDGEDICHVQVEVTDQVYLDDMKNIDIIVVYSCKKCGYGDQNAADAIQHSRSCSYKLQQEELYSKLLKVFNLFKSFSHRSVPLTECIAPVVPQNPPENEVQKPVHEPKELVANLKPKKEPRILKDITEEDVETLVAKCREAWEKTADKDDEAAVILEPRKWFCTKCAATVICSETELHYHKECHTEDSAAKKFSCSLCKTSEEGRRKILECDDWNTMKTHLTTIHKVNMKLKCPICGSLFPNHQKYHKHVRSHKYQCRFGNCGFCTTTQETIYTHERCHNLEDRSKFKCLKCDWVSETLAHKWSQMHIHLTKEHPGTIEPLYKCQLCEREFTEQRRFNAHMNSCKLLPKPLRPTCLVCGKFVADHELRDHILKHASRRYWYLKLRDVLGKTQEELRGKPHDSDSQSTNPDKLIQVTKSELDSSTDGQNQGEGEPEKKKQKRVLVSSGLLTERCKHCYKKFATPQRLEKHMKRSHPDGGQNLTVCDTCGAAFRNKEQWRNHNRQVHLGLKRKAAKTQKSSSSPKLYMCDTCTYATPNMARLRNHFQSVHLGKQPYACNQCQYTTNEPSDLRRHALKHEGKKPYSCSHCEYRTTQRWILVSHMQRAHGITLPKNTRNTGGCEFSMKRNPAIAPGMRRDVITVTPATAVGAVVEAEPVQVETPHVQIEELNGEVMLQIDESEVTATETVQILASLASGHPAGSHLVIQEQQVIEDGQHGGGEVIMVKMEEEVEEEGE